MKDFKDAAEQAISDARTAIVNAYDEDLPDITAAAETHNSLKTRLRLAIEKLDQATVSLEEFGYEFLDVEDKRDELRDELQYQEKRADSTEFGILAESLLRELQGRMMTDSPERVVWWMENALETILAAPTPDDEKDANTLLTAATWRN